MEDPVDALRLGTPRGRVALAATVLASSMASLDGTIVNVALPHIQRDLHTDVTGLQWVLTGYFLTLASLILLGGAAGDRYGRRRVLVIGVVWFTLASVACAVAPTIEVLVAARLLQGVGGALVTPGSLAIIQASFHPDDRGAAVGAWAGLGGVAGAIGPFVGGAIIGGPGWRWAFLVNAPLGVAMWWCSRSIPESSDPGAEGFDVAGAALATGGLIGVTWMLNEAGNRGWANPVVWAPGLLGVAAMAGFVVLQRRSSHPLVPPSLFASRVFTVLNVATFTLYAALGVVFFLLVYQLQEVSGWSPIAAGSALLPGTVLLILFSSRSGALASRIGPRPQLVIGPLLVAVSVVMLGTAGKGTTFIGLLPASVLFGVGLVTFVAPLTATVMAAAHPDHVSVASGVNNAVARTGTLAAIATVPLAAGLGAAVGAGALTEAYRRAMWITAGLAASAALVSLAGLAGTFPEMAGEKEK